MSIIAIFFVIFLILWQIGITISKSMRSQSQAYYEDEEMGLGDKLKASTKHYANGLKFAIIVTLILGAIKIFANI